MSSARSLPLVQLLLLQQLVPDRRPRVAAAAQLRSLEHLARRDGLLVRRLLLRHARLVDGRSPALPPRGHLLHVLLAKVFREHVVGGAGGVDGRCRGRGGGCSRAGYVVDVDCISPLSAGFEQEEERRKAGGEGDGTLVFGEKRLDHGVALDVVAAAAVTTSSRRGLAVAAAAAAVSSTLLAMLMRAGVSAQIGGDFDLDELGPARRRRARLHRPECAHLPGLFLLRLIALGRCRSRLSVGGAGRETRFYICHPE